MSFYHPPETADIMAERGLIGAAAALIAKSKRYVLFYGAGASVASGIPTFRGAGGLYGFPGKRYLLLGCFVCGLVAWVTVEWGLKWLLLSQGAALAVLGILYVATPLLVIRLIAGPLPWRVWWLRPILWVIYKLYFHDGIARASPNTCHRFIRYLVVSCGTDAVRTVTQNVDCLEAGAGATDVLQVHHSYERLYCADCKKFHETDYLKKTLPWRSPVCAFCGKRAIRTGCMLFHDGRNPNGIKWGEARAEFFKMTEDTDLVIVVGTTGLVRPAGDFPKFRGPACSLLEINPSVQVYTEPGMPLGDDPFTSVTPGDGARGDAAEETGDILYLPMRGEVALARIARELHRHHGFNEMAEFRR